MMKILLTAFLFLAWWLPGSAVAQGLPQYGEFTAIRIDWEIVKDVIAEGNDIYVKLDPRFQNEEIIVKISNDLLAGYRTWAEGEVEKIVKIYHSNRRNKLGYTYRIHTSAKFVEYWIKEDLILHLERNQ